MKKNLYFMTVLSAILGLLLVGAGAGAATKVLHWTGELETAYGSGTTVEQAITYANIITTQSNFSPALPGFKTVDLSELKALGHGNNSAALGMWQTVNDPNSSSADPNTPIPSSPAWIRYKFDQAYTLGTMMVWNFNQFDTSGKATGRGLRNVDIYYSADGMTNWQKLGDYEFARAPGTPNCAPTTLVDFGGISARGVIIVADPDPALGRWRGTASDWKGYGLSEVRFGIKNTSTVIPVTSLGFADASGNGYYGGVGGNGTPATGQGDGLIGHCIKFNGASNSFVANSTVALAPYRATDTWSMNFFVKLDETPQGWSGLMGFGANSSTYNSTTNRSITGGGSMQFNSDNGHVANGFGPWEVGKWQMITLTNDGTNVKFYKNGVVLKSVTTASMGFTTNNNGAATRVYIGKQIFNDVQYIKGLMDEVTLWNGALTQEEITAMASDVIFPGDYDGDIDVDTTDFKVLVSEWLEPDMVDVQASTKVVENFESYANTTAMKASWNDWTYDTGTSTVALINDGDKALQWTYDNTGGKYSEIYYKIADPNNPNVALADYDRLRLKVNRHGGNSAEGMIYVKFLDSGLTTSNIAAELIVSSGNTTSGDPNQWVELSLDFYNKLSFPTYSAQANGYYSIYQLKKVTGLLIGCFSASGGGTGTIDIDDVELDTYVRDVAESCDTAADWVWPFAPAGAPFATQSVSDPNVGVVKLHYDNSVQNPATGNYSTDVAFVPDAAPIDLTQYDKIIVKAKYAAANSKEIYLYLDILNGGIAAENFALEAHKHDTAGSTQQTPADTWLRWDIDLHSTGHDLIFQTANGYTKLSQLTNVTAMIIGCTHETSPGGQGDIDIDSIELVVTPGCKSLADLTGDCKVTMDDFKVLAQNWLKGL